MNPWKTGKNLSFIEKGDIKCHEKIYAKSFLSWTEVVL